MINRFNTSEYNIIKNNYLDYQDRNNSFCVISKQTYGNEAVRDIQTNSSWISNPYDNYAIVPDNMVQDILKTSGFCDIQLNEDGTEIISFTAYEK